MRKIARIELLKKVQEILHANTEDPSESLIKEGEALASIGRALKDVGIHDARAVLRAVGELEGLN